jgi:thiol:disulfide interchange protein
MFTPQKLAQLSSERKTVMVDFTADWCMICKTLEATVLNTEEVVSAVALGGVVPLQADFTRKPPEIVAILDELESAGVPVLAIYPANSPDKPIVFKGPYTIGDVLDALEKAGPSEATDPQSATAMTAP